jgi:TolB-like protein/class 3 adenylate cyclase
MTLAFDCRAVLGLLRSAQIGEEIPLAREQRRLAAIIAADVVSYSRLMGRDESGTLARLREHRKLRFEPTLARHGGRLVKLTGDGALAEFASAVDALDAAIEFQQTMAEANRDQPEDTAIVFRIGLHLGDLIVDGDDLYGDGVNVAARLEAEALPGGIIVSRAVREAVEGRLKANFHALGDLALKNIERPIRAFRVEWDEADWRPQVTRAPKPPGPAESSTPALALPDKPSIAVLPFQNMSGDPEQEYFADGMVEDIITGLSRMRWLFVIARNSSFTYKGRAVDLKQVGRELGVRYVLEGSVRKAVNRVRITGQLIDTATGAHLWADHFDGGLEDVFDLQDRVTMDVVGAIAPTLERAEIDRAKRKPTESLDAYDYFLRGMSSVHQWTSDANDVALRLFRKAIELDPDFASAYGMAAWCYVWRMINRWTIDRAQETTEATRLARRAVDLGADDAVALCMGGYALVFAAHDLDGGAALIDRALSMNPNLAWAWHSSGWTRDFLGEPELAIKNLEHGMRLSPLDPFVFRAYAGLACAHLLAGRYDESSLWAERALQRRPNLAVAVREAAVSNALAGRLIEAQKAMAQLRQLDPELRISNIADWLPLRQPQDIARYEEGLRKAGLPE